MANSFKSFTLALIQLGRIGLNKGENLEHAREMVLQAASGSHAQTRPDIIVLPVCISIMNFVIYHDWDWGHYIVVDPMGRVLAEAGEVEEIVYAQIEPEVFQSTRAGIPVTLRRFDVYPDVGWLLN